MRIGRERKEELRRAERAKVAGVFVNRLKRGMRLQSDPTVIYSLTEGAGPLDRALTRADWKVDHPYNTYQNAGLPPGPIATALLELELAGRVERLAGGRVSLLADTDSPPQNAASR